VKIPNQDGDAAQLLAEKGVKIGTAPDINKFPGEKDWVRICLAVPEDVLREGMLRFRACFEQARK
jgi:hypothetical protein